MNLPSSVINAQHGHPGQKVLEHLAQFQKRNALLKESLDLSQKALARSQEENALRQELAARLQAQDFQQRGQMTQLQEKVEVLEAEVRRLKKLPPKPDIKPNTKAPDDPDDSPGDPLAVAQTDEADPDGVPKRKVSKPDESTRNPHGQSPKPPPDKSVPVPACDVPPGSARNGTAPFYARDLVIKESAMKVRLGFFALIRTRTGRSALQEALSSLAVIEEELLLVLEGPGLPLRDNLSESLIRKYVSRRKVSGGTRSEAGRQSRGTYAGLKKTCRLYGLSFRDCLTDRLSGIGWFPRLGEIIEKASSVSPRGLPRVTL